MRTLEHTSYPDSQAIYIAWAKTGGDHFESITGTHPSLKTFLGHDRLIKLGKTKQMES